MFIKIVRKTNGYGLIQFTRNMSKPNAIRLQKRVKQMVFTE
jgi:hypothetical protein